MKELFCLLVAASILIVWTITEPKYSDVTLSDETLEAVYEAAGTIPYETHVSTNGNDIVITVDRGKKR